MNYVLKSENLRVYYILPKGIYVKAVDGVSVEVPERSFTGLVGESGSGKTTLAESLLYLIEPPMVKISGRVYYRGIDLESLDHEARRKLYGKRLALIPQYAMDALNPTIRISKFILDLAKSHDVDGDELLSRAFERLKLVGLSEDVLNKYPHELSGGMRQRAVVVISTLLNPEVLVADEPVSNLDVLRQHVVLDLFEELLRKGYVGTILMVTHDLPLILERANNLFIMYGGHIVETGSCEAVLREPLHPYTQMFIRSIPPVGTRIKTTKLKGVQGNPPDLRFPPPGCRFHPRCPLVMDKCRVEEPPLVSLSGDRSVKCWLYAK
ncbi:MAG: ABC transporter ATP-binding protein [Desulfurococcaceae archaeon]